jgi:transposase
MGKSGRDMLDAVVAGETDPAVLAQLARRQMRKKIPALREALAGHFDEHHRLWIGAILAHIDFLDEQIARLSVMIEEQIALSPARLSCCARSPASSTAVPSASWPRSART